MPAEMSASPILNARASDEIVAAVDAYCAEKGITKAQLIQRAVCRELKRPDLLKTIRPEGRSKSAAKQAASKPGKKSK